MPLHAATAKMAESESNIAAGSAVEEVVPKRREASAKVV